MDCHRAPYLSQVYNVLLPQLPQVLLGVGHPDLRTLQTQSINTHQQCMSTRDHMTAAGNVGLGAAKGTIRRGPVRTMHWMRVAAEFTEVDSR